MKPILRYVLVLTAFTALSAASGQARADFLDITSLTTETAGTFSGTLASVSVTGAITTTTPLFGFDPTGPLYGDSTIDNSSPQFSYSNVFSPAIAATDRVGYTTLAGTFNPATITINFSSAILNPIFHIANLDSMQYDFSPTVGLSGLALLSGNGGGGDGLQVVGNVISDADPATLVGTAPTMPPPTTGARSAYGSVELLGSFTSLTINVSNPGLGGDSGSFTLSTNNASVPEPAFVAMSSLLALGGSGLLLRRHKQSASRI